MLQSATVVWNQTGKERTAEKEQFHVFKTIIVIAVTFLRSLRRTQISKDTKERTIFYQETFLLKTLKEKY